MAITCVTNCGFPLKKRLNSAGHTITASQAQELIAAALGYKSLASLQSCSRGQLADDMTGAEGIVLCRDTLSPRLVRFSLPTTDEFLLNFRALLSEIWSMHFGKSMPLHWDLDELLEEIMPNDLIPDDYFGEWLVDNNAYADWSAFDYASLPTLGPGAIPTAFERISISVDMDLSVHEDRMLSTGMGEYYSGEAVFELPVVFSLYGPRGISFEYIDAEI